MSGNRLLFLGSVSWFHGTQVLHGPVDDTAIDPDALAEVLVLPSFDRLDLRVHHD